MRECAILLVEDNLADVVFFQEAAKEALADGQVFVVENGEQALRFLRRQEPYADAPRPDVVVLDLNLPVKNGQEVLAEMAHDAKLKEIDVAILTTSTSETDVCKLCTGPGQCRYFVKTDSFDRLQEIIRQIAALADH